MILRHRVEIDIIPRFPWLILDIVCGALLQATIWRVGTSWDTWGLLKSVK